MAVMVNMTKIYAAWENAEEMAEDLGQRGVTVRQWRNRNSIPPEHWANVIEKAALRGVILSIADFGGVPPVVGAVDRAFDAQRKAAA